MNKHIKDFIEENIEEIENEDWYGVFFSWYLHWATYNVVKDEQLIMELFDVLRKAFDNVIIDSLDLRKIIVQDAMEEYIKARADNSNAVTVGYTAAVDNLNSRLALERDDLLDVFRDAAKQCGFNANNSLVIRLK